MHCAFTLLLYHTFNVQPQTGRSQENNSSYHSSQKDQWLWNSFYWSKIYKSGDCGLRFLWISLQSQTQRN